MTVEQAIAYAERSTLYLSNASEMLREQRPEKSSEFLWGSMAEALKAVAAIKDTKLRTHAEIRRFARDLAKQLQSDRLLDVFSIAETLHSNFYEAMFDEAEVLHHSTSVREVIGTLLDLVPRGQPEPGEVR